MRGTNETEGKEGNQSVVRSSWEKRRQLRCFLIRPLPTALPAVAPYTIRVSGLRL